MDPFVHRRNLANFCAHDPRGVPLDLAAPQRDNRTDAEFSAELKSGKTEKASKDEVLKAGKRKNTGKAGKAGAASGCDWTHLSTAAIGQTFARTISGARRSVSYRAVATPGSQRTIFLPERMTANSPKNSGIITRERAFPRPSPAQRAIPDGARETNPRNFPEG
jgi:hypothetical protein